MNGVFTENGCKDYDYWQTEDKKTLRRNYSCQKGHL